MREAAVSTSEMAESAHPRSRSHRLAACVSCRVVSLCGVVVLSYLTSISFLIFSASLSRYTPSSSIAPPMSNEDCSEPPCNTEDEP
jgi:hypothetical protein